MGRAIVLPALFPSLFPLDLLPRGVVSLGLDVITFHDHPAPCSLVLHHGRHGHAQCLRCFQWEVDVSQYLSSKEDDISFAVLDDIVGLHWVGNQTDGTDEHIGNILLNVRGERDL